MEQKEKKATILHFTRGQQIILKLWLQREKRGKDIN